MYSKITATAAAAAKSLGGDHYKKQILFPSSGVKSKILQF